MRTNEINKVSIVENCKLILKNSHKNPSNHPKIKNPKSLPIWK